MMEPENGDPLGRGELWWKTSFFGFHVSFEAVLE